MNEVVTPVEIFCCYAHEDETWRQKLETHLNVLKRQGLTSLWHDRLIVPGTDWAEAIDTHLETSSIVLLLVSVDFFLSDYCYGIEMKRAMERQETGEALVIPILVRPVDWNSALFAHLQVLPTDAKPLSTWQNEEIALTNVTAGIRRAIKNVAARLSVSTPRAALPTIWNIPYPRNPFFLGRESELAQMHSHLQGGQATALSQPQAISGLGGIGKTQLALEYAYRYRQDYQAVLWARAESTESLVSSYIALALLLRLPESGASEQEITIQAVKKWLQTHRGWLLILDNADELALLADFLPSSLGGHLLLTTRAAATGRLAYRMEIKTLQPGLGALFLLRRAALLAPEATLEEASQEEQEQALRMSKELGGLPLALDQAGAYLEETGMSPFSYWHIYQQHRADLLQQRGGLVADHPAPVATTWSLSFEKVAEKNLAAVDLLRLCAFLSPDAIPEEILTAGASWLGPVLAPVAADTFLLNQAIEALHAYSLIRRDPKGKNLSVHRLVQAVLQDAMKETEKHTWAERAMYAVNAAFPHVQYSTWLQCERLLPQVLTTTQVIKECQIISKESGRLFHETACYLRERGRYASAEPLFLHAIHIWEQLFGKEHSSVVNSLTGLATLYWEHGKYGEAETLFSRALHICEQQFGSEHPNVIYPLHSLASLYREQGKFSQAEPLFLHALHIGEQQLEPEHPLVADSLNRLATLYREQGKYTEAERLYQRALCIQEQQLGPEHPKVAYTLRSLAILYRQQNKYSEAELLYQRALCIQEQQLGLEHPEVAYTLNNLASLYRRWGAYEEAESLYQRALHIWEQQSGPKHPYIGHPLNGLAVLYREQGKYAEAERLYQRALYIRESQLGSEHPNMTYSLHGLATLYYLQGKYAEAERLYQRALHIWEKALLLEHPEAAKIMYDLAQLQEVQGNSNEARAWYTRALAIREQTFGIHHPKTTEIRHRLIALLYTIGQHEEAARLEATQLEP